MLNEREVWLENLWILYITDFNIFDIFFNISPNAYKVEFAPIGFVKAKKLLPAEAWILKSLPKKKHLTEIRERWNNVVIRNTVSRTSIWPYYNAHFYRLFYILGYILKKDEQAHPLQVWCVSTVMNAAEDIDKKSCIRLYAIHSVLLLSRSCQN